MVSLTNPNLDSYLKSDGRLLFLLHILQQIMLLKTGIWQTHFRAATVNSAINYKRVSVKVSKSRRPMEKNTFSKLLKASFTRVNDFRPRSPASTK